MIVDTLEAMMKPTHSATATSIGDIIPTGTPTSVPGIPGIHDNPPPQTIGHKGETTLWVIFAAMLIGSALFAGWSWKVPVSKRLYHVLITLTMLISTVSYFAMATGQGSAFKHTTIHHEHKHLPGDITSDETISRQIFWAHFVNWILTTPLLLLALGVLSGLNGAHLLMAVVANIFMFVTGLSAAFGHATAAQKWGMFIFSCLSYLVVVWHLAVNGRAQAQTKSDNVSNFYTAIGGFFALVLAGYPIIWGIALGGHLSVSAEQIAYAVLDVLTQPIFGLWLLITTAKVTEANVDLRGFWSTGMDPEGRLRLDDEDGA